MGRPIWASNHKFWGYIIKNIRAHISGKLDEYGD
jgi:hypothetical protein